MAWTTKWVLVIAALTAVGSTVPAVAQPFGYGDDGPPRFRGGPGWDGPGGVPPWARWHHRHWRDEGDGERGWRNGDRRRDRDRFGREGEFSRDDGFGRGRDRTGVDDGGRRFGGDGPRDRGPDRGEFRHPFTDD